MNRSTPGLPAHHQLLEFTQTHVHRVSDAIQPSLLCRPPSLKDVTNSAKHVLPPAAVLYNNGSTGTNNLEQFLIHISDRLHYENSIL